MIFNSYAFLFFFPIVVSIYFLIPKRFQWILLLLASYFFYGYMEPSYVLLLVYSTLVDFIAGINIYKSRNKLVRRFWLLFGLLNNLSILFYFKYIDFLRNIFGTTDFSDSTVAKMIIPVGLSFYTLQTMSYSIDIYRGYLKPERHIGRFALFVAFFPQLVAGPIEKAKNMLPQLIKGYDFDYQRVVEGFRLMLWGFFKKLVIADRLGMYVDVVFANPENHHGLAAILAGFFYMFQVFLDFSAYTDIAIGIARIFGINLTKNFTNRPYATTSPRHFWREYHITLTDWFRSYFFLTISKLNHSKLFWLFSLFLTFVLTGLWHGAGWTFIAWGAMHGIMLVVDYMTLVYRQKIIKKYNIEKLLKWIAPPFIMLLFLPTAIIFRSKNIGNAMLQLKNCLEPTNENWLLINRVDFGAIVVLLIFYDIIGRLMKQDYFFEYLNNKREIVRWSFYLVMFLAITQFGVFYNQKFIYFQF